MLKKLLAVIIMMVYMATFLSSAWAEESTDENGSDGTNKIEISFKVGDEILKINGEDVKVEKPIVINGVTLVPVRVITEAFGADVNWDAEQRLVTLDYSGVNIKLYIDNKIAVVDDTDTELLEAPRIINGRTMVPLRFITENFGADVGYESETRAITVVKEIAGENSIKDFSLILKKTTKTKVGDSYYNWSMDFPKSLKLKYRNFGGTLNHFEADDESYYIFITIIKQEDQTLDTLLSAKLNEAKDYTLLYQGKVKEEDKEFVKVVWRDKTSCAEYRAFIKDSVVYRITTGFDDYTKYKGNSDIQDQLNSFGLGFPSDNSVEDLSDIDKDGFRPYENKNLKLSFKMLPDWIKIESEDKENEVFFYDSDFESMFYCTMYSYDEGLTLDKLVEEEKKELNDEYNTNLFKLVKVEDSKVNEIDCKVLYYTLQKGSEMIYVTDIYVLGENYKYNFGCNMDSETYNNPALKSKINSMLYSFEFTEPDPDELGLMLDADRVETSNEMRTVKSDKFNWSIELPVSWIEGEDNNNEDYLQYWNNKEYMGIDMIVFEGVTSYSSFVSQFETGLKNKAATTSDLFVEGITTVNEKGMSIKKFTYTVKIGTQSYKQWAYMLNKNDKVYLVTFSISDLRKSQNNLDLLAEIWNSMKFE